VTTTLLAGDIGGTKTLLSLYRWDGVLHLLSGERFASADWPDLGAMVQHFLGGDARRGFPPPAAACFAVAGPVQGGQARLTNLTWQLSETGLAQACGIERVELVNDFAVLIHGLPHLQPAQLAAIQEGVTQQDEPRLILGAGTGLGVAIGIPTAAGLKAVASEAAHGEFAPRHEREWQLKQWLRHHLGLERVSIERVVSGTGLGHVARWLLASRQSAEPHPLDAVAADLQADLPAAVAAAAQRGEPLAREALELWLSAYGSVVGDLALASLSRGGIWLAGGTAAKLLEPLRSPVFRAAFLAKGRLRPALETMPIQALIDPEVGSFSAACRAKDLVG
jgi:glucokinase